MSHVKPPRVTPGVGGGRQRMEPPTLADMIGQFSGEHILAELILLMWIFCIWELYLTFRQRRLMQKLVKKPAILDDLIEDNDYRKARDYSLDTNTFGIIENLYSSTINTIFKIYFGIYLCWEYSIKLIEYLGLDQTNEIFVSVGYNHILIFFITIVQLPFTIYGTFVLEQKHSFNKQTPLFFVKDQIIKYLVTNVLTVPLVCGIVWIVNNGGDYFYIYLWVFAVTMSLLMMMIYPEFIAPLFDKYTPLPEGNLRVQIENLASSLGFPLYKLYVVEGSKRSSHSNAYLYGFYKYKRIVLFDTLVAEYQRKKLQAEKDKTTIELDEENKKETKNEKEEIRGCETDEIVAVLAHELGHWHHSHAIMGFFLGQIVLLLNFVLFSKLMHYAPLYKAFGFTDSKPVMVGLLIITTYVLAPLNTFLGWLLTIVTRRNEFQADDFARRLGHSDALGRALVKLHKDNKSYPLFDWLYSNWHHSHPPLLERLDALKKAD